MSLAASFLVGKIYSVAIKAAAVGAGVLVLTKAPIPWKQLLSKKRDKLSHVFELGQIHVNQKYPKVIRVSKIHKGEEIEFQVPVGLDPVIVERKHWLFEQVFGEHIELVRKSNRYVLKVYEGSLPQGKDIPYNYDLLAQYVEGMSLPIVVGEGRHGFVAYDMKPNPGLLVTGETGSGKSSLLRVSLTFLIQHFTPKQLHMYLVDLKWSEFHIFKRCKHIRAWTADPDDVLRKILAPVERQMQLRGRFLDRYEVSHIDQLPPRIRKHLPYVLLAIDEVAVLGLKLPNTEKPSPKGEMTLILDKIASQGRALGIFCMLSMQRPDSDVLPGRTKNNFTVRATFRQSNDINERVSDAPGASLIDTEAKGRMIFSFNGFQQVQAPWLSEQEAKQMISEWYKPVQMKPKPVPKSRHLEVQEIAGDSLPTLVRDRRKSWAEEFPPSEW